MREYGTIDSELWARSEFKKLSDDAKLLTCYLRTCRHCNLVWCFYCPPGYIVADLGWTLQRVHGALAELAADRFALYCDEAEYIYLPKCLERFPINGVNSQTGAMTIIDSIPTKCLHLPDLLTYLRDRGSFVEGPLKALQSRLQGLGIPLRSQEQDQEQDQEQETPDPGGKPPACPHEELIKLYHETLPTCPRVKVWTGKRQAHMRQRWREYPSIDEWREFFRRVKASRFLTGGVPAGRGRSKPFVADLAWLVNPDNFAKVLEGKYAG